MACTLVMSALSGGRTNASVDMNANVISAEVHVGGDAFVDFASEADVASNLVPDTDEVALLDIQVEEAPQAVDESNPSEPQQDVKLIKIGSGDTMAGVLQGIGVSGVDAYHIVKAMSKHYDPRRIKPGQAISVELQEIDDAVSVLGVNMRLDAIKEIVISKDVDTGRYVSELDEKKIVKRLKTAQTNIETSLYGSAARAGIPASVVAEMIRIYSYEVDFQRDIREGDGVEVFYEVYETEDGDFARYGNILFANLSVGGSENAVYRFEDGKSVDYYRENGRSLKRTLMMTPVDGARISSGYGMRHHPVLGYNKMHKGVDFAAPRGTPIYAAGDGVVEKASRFGAYGNYVRIRHNGDLKTAYAHMKSFAKGIRAGSRVKQGQVIGYIGTTGRSTGPHLHFEVLRNGKQVNPKSIKSSPGQLLAGAKLKKFKAIMTDLQEQYASLSNGIKVAQNNLSQ